MIFAADDVCHLHQTVIDTDREVESWHAIRTLNHEVTHHFIEVEGNLTTHEIGHFELRIFDLEAHRRLNAQSFSSFNFFCTEIAAAVIKTRRSMLKACEPFQLVYLVLGHITIISL